MIIVDFILRRKVHYYWIILYLKAIIQMETDYIFIFWIHLQYNTVFLNATNFYLLATLIFDWPYGLFHTDMKIHNCEFNSFFIETNIEY